MENLQIPIYIKTIVNRLKLKDINPDLMAKLFLEEMYKFNLRGNTVNKHFNLIKPILFPNTFIVPNIMSFDNKSSPQNRIPIFENIEILVQYINVSSSKYKWPLLLGYYSGLRLREILQLKFSHIFMILNKIGTIPIIRKNKSKWNVLYYDSFMDFINQLRYVAFKDGCNSYSQNRKDSLLFKNINPISLHTKIHEFYILANNGKKPPRGFGLHIFRYFNGTRLAKQGGIRIAQLYLGHKNIRTTEIYVKLDVREYKERFRTINNRNYFYSNILKSVST